MFPLAAAGLLLGAMEIAHAQQPFDAAPPTAPAVAAGATPAPIAARFDALLGRIVQTHGDGSTTYSLQATQPLDSKLTGQKVRLMVEDAGPQGTFTRVLALRTGKHKTVGQFCEILRDIFRKYVRETAAGQELGKIGDLRYGGEIRFIAESPQVLRYETRTEGEEDHAAKLSADDVANIVALLGGTAKPAAAH